MLRVLTTWVDPGEFWSEFLRIACIFFQLAAACEACFRAEDWQHGADTDGSTDSLADIGSVLLIAMVPLQIQIKNSNLLKSTLTKVIRIMQRTSQNMHVGWWADF